MALIAAAADDRGGTVFWFGDGAAPRDAHQRALTSWQESFRVVSDYIDYEPWVFFATRPSGRTAAASRSLKSLAQRGATIFVAVDASPLERPPNAFREFEADADFVVRLDGLQPDPGGAGNLMVDVVKARKHAAPGWLYVTVGAPRTPPPRAAMSASAK